MGLDKDKQGRFLIKYQYSHCLEFHKLLSVKRISKTFLCSILGVSQRDSAIRLINQPLKLTFQQLINLSFLLDVSLYSLIDVIRLDVSNCATSFDPELQMFVPPHLVKLSTSKEWFDR